MKEEVEERLGSGASEAEEIKSHPFFSSLDWNTLVSAESFEGQE